MSYRILIEKRKEWGRVREKGRKKGKVREREKEGTEGGSRRRGSMGKDLGKLDNVVTEKIFQPFLFR